MQVVDVLRDDEAQHSQLFQLNKREMAWVRLGDSERFVQFVVAFAEPLLQAFFGSAMKR